MTNSNSKVSRNNGITRIDFGRMQIKTRAINRHRYNDLRKVQPLRKWDVFVFLKRVFFKK